VTPVRSNFVIVMSQPVQSPLPAAGTPKVEPGPLLVTGGGRGIGAATVRAAAAAGYAVCVNYRSRRREAEDLADSVVQAGGRAMAVQADTSVEADVLRMFAAIDRQWGPLRGLVNNAGITGAAGSVSDVTLATLREVIDVNVIGCFLCAREAVRRMSTRNGGPGGSIVNVSSRAAVLGGPGEWVHYAASKGAIDTMTVGLAREVGGQGIRVNAVRPGLIDTEIHAAGGDPDRLERLRPNVPVGRIGTAAEVAATIVWLLGEQASYVSGALVDVSGAR
jgi:NAD(P)-dependent dehydrogenase (short-subunit alcohol dehydrogenase family)